MFDDHVPALDPAHTPPDAHLLDVREDDEWLAGHAPGTIHLPMTQVPHRMAEIPDEGDVVVVCRSGHRSAQVVAYLMGHGRHNVRNLRDGMLGWVATGRPLISEYPDREPTVI